jgi:hypothetical protein
MSRRNSAATPAPADRSAGHVCPVTQDDLDFIACTDPTRSGTSPYRGVYRDGRGWQARVNKRRVGAVQSSAREAAKLVVRWWKAEYGEGWRAFFAYRQTQGWTTLPAGRGRVWVVAFVGGAAVMVGERRGAAVPAAGQSGVRPFADKASAARAVRAWADDTYGGKATAVLRRRWAPTHNPGRLSPVAV